MRLSVRASATRSIPRRNGFAKNSEIIHPATPDKRPNPIDQNDSMRGRLSRRSKVSICERKTNRRVASVLRGLSGTKRERLILAGGFFFAQKRQPQHDRGRVRRGGRYDAVG